MSIQLNTIKRSKLPELIAEFCKRGARPMSVTLRTIKSLTKAQRQLLEVPELVKIASYSTILNFDYERSVNRQLEREGKESNFKTRPMYYEHVSTDPRPIVRHKEDKSKIYLQLKLEKALKELYLSPKGSVIDSNKVHEAIPAKSYPKQGLEKAVLTMTPSLDSIITIVCDNQEYEIVD